MKLFKQSIDDLEMNILGAVVNDRECCNLTPLHWAAWGGHCRIVQVAGIWTFGCGLETLTKIMLLFVRAFYQIKLLFQNWKVLRKSLGTSLILSNKPPSIFFVGPSCFWCACGYKRFRKQYTTDTCFWGWLSGYCSGWLTVVNFMSERGKVLSCAWWENLLSNLRIEAFSYASFC